MKCFIVIAVLLISGCASTPPPAPTERQPLTIPEYLLKRCKPEKPDSISVGDLIELQNLHLERCDNQINTIESLQTRSKQNASNNNE